MKKFSFFFKTFIAVSALTLTSFVIAGCSLDRKAPLEKKFDKIVKELNLSTEQKQKADQIKSDIKNRWESDVKAREASRKEISDMIRGESIDKEKLNALILQNKEAMTKNRESFHDFMVDKLIEFHKILTPEQRAKAADLFLEKKDYFGKRFDRKRHFDFE